MPADTLKASAGEAHCPRGVIVQREEDFGEGARVSRRDEETATGAVHEFGKCAMGRLDDGDAAGHGLEEE
jgi:hypothetical protein